MDSATVAIQTKAGNDRAFVERLASVCHLDLTHCAGACGRLAATRSRQVQWYLTVSSLDSYGLGRWLQEARHGVSLDEVVVQGRKIPLGSHAIFDHSVRLNFGGHLWDGPDGLQEHHLLKVASPLAK